MKTLYIIRGLPGSGKSTLGHELASEADGYYKRHSVAADDWFCDQYGEYNFVPEELSDAHEDCRSRVMGRMMSGVEKICVCNTFSQAWEAEPYFKLCKQYYYTPVVLECQSQFGNVHGVPQESIDEMKERWEPLSKPNW
jgi:predicted kinase